jgi:cyclohexanecarboxyl-CoA dehydrogenase
MDFSLNEEQTVMVKMIRDFVKKELQSTYAHWDRTDDFPVEHWRKMGNLGLIGMNVASEEGGQGTDSVTTGLAAEEIAKGDSNMAIASFVVGELITGIIEKYGSGQAKKDWLGPIIAGKKVPALCVTEPHAGTDASAMHSRAIRKGDRYILSGEKSGITLMMSSDMGIVFAKTNPEAGARGISAFVVPTDLPGITRQSYEDIGGKCLKRGSMFMDEVEVPDEYLLGKEGEGFKIVMRGFDFSRVILALICIGAAEITLEETIKYTKERHAFNMPLAKFEGVSFPIAEHCSIIEAVRCLCYRSLWLRDQGLPHTAEAAMCKWMAPRYAVNAIRDCLLLHGHYGYTQEFPIEQRLRDIMGIEIADGTAQVSKIVITREIFGREFLPY